MHLSIITVNYNQTDYTCALLKSIQKANLRDVEVWVVDNASFDDPEIALKAVYPHMHYIRSDINLGFAGGNNLAVRQATGDYLFFINNDAEITPGCLEQLIAFLQSHPKAGVVSPLICYYPEAQTALPKPDLIQYAGMTQVHPITARNKTIGSHEPDQGQYPMPMPTAYAHGAAMLLPRSVIDHVGLMNEDFFLYYEELDWCERIRKAGYEVWVEPRVRIYHKESATVQKLGALKTYYLNRNRVWFMRKHHKGLSLLLFYLFLFCFTIPKNTLLYLIKGEQKNLAAFLKGVFWNFR
jgi:GT2 family glycosyltransferase